jgi:Type II secretion system (T2SS), protein E, N-terminal domain
MLRIGELLVAEGVLTPAAVQRALDVQRLARVRLGTILLDWDLLAEEKLLAALGVLHRCEAVGWERLAAAPPAVVRLLPPTTAVRLSAIPYALEGRSLRVAFTNPSNLDAVDEVSAVTGRRILPSVVSELRLLQAHHLFYGRPIPAEYRTIVQRLEGRLERRRPGFSPTAQGAPVSLTGEATPASGLPTISDFEPPEFPLPEGAEPPGEASLPAMGSALSTPSEEEASELAEEPSSAEEAHEGASGMWKASTINETQEDLVSGMWSNAAGEARLDPPTSREEIARHALDLAPDLPRVLLLASGPKGVTGWRGRGPGLLEQGVASLRIPWSRASIFVNVKLWGTPHFGTATEDLWPSALGVLLEAAPPFPCAVFPIKIQERVVALLYADRLGEPLTASDYESLEKATGAAGAALARLILRQKQGPPPPVH